MGRRLDLGDVDAERDAGTWLRRVGLLLMPATEDPEHPSARHALRVRRDIQRLRDRREREGFRLVEVAEEVRALLATEGLERYGGYADRSGVSGRRGAPGERRGRDGTPRERV